MIGPEEIRQALSYNPDTGAFTWKRRESPSWDGRHAGKPAGCVKGKGYISIRLNGKDYLAHRLAWLCVKGTIPERIEVAHVNRRKTDNRLANLRLATSSQNKAKRARKNILTGVDGVTMDDKGKRYRATIATGGVIIFLGTFDALEEAAAARRAAESKYYGDFARAARV